MNGVQARWGDLPGSYGDVLPGTALGKLLMMLTVAAGLLYATILFAALFQALREE